MRILFVTARFPYPPLKGDQMVPYYRIRHLSQRHEITLISLCESEPEVEHVNHMRRYCQEVHYIRLEKWRSMLNIVFGAPFSNLPMQTLYYYTPELKRNLTRLIKTEKFDLIQAYLLRLTPMLKNLGVPTVVDLIDSMQLNLNRRIAKETPLMRWILRNELHRLASYETNLGDTFPHMIVTSDIDRQHITTGKVHSIPLGVDVERFIPTEESNSDPVIIFSGNMAYNPNIQAIIWFIKACFSHILSAVPDAKLIIAGANPPPEIRDLHRPGQIEVTGFVDSIADVMQGARVAIAPMQSGSGMQFKILEAMSCGLPVVTTSIGLGSIKAKVDSEICVADTPSDFASYVIKILTEPNFTQLIGQRARTFVIEHHSWEQSARRVEEIYQLVINNNPNISTGKPSSI